MKKKLNVYNGYLMAVADAQTILSKKFATQLNMWDRRKIGYNFAFMFASGGVINVLQNLMLYNSGE